MQKVFKKLFTPFVYCLSLEGLIIHAVKKALSKLICCKIGEFRNDATVTVELLSIFFSFGYFAVAHA